jgi:anti-anti-sigma factor
MSLLFASAPHASLALHVAADSGQIVRARVKGRLAHRFQAPFDEPLATTVGFDAYQRRVMLDLSAVTRMETSGISWLLTLRKRMQSVGGRLVLHSLSPAVRNVVRVLKLQSVLEIAANEKDAQQLITGESA